MELAEKFCQIIEEQHGRIVTILARKARGDRYLAEDVVQQAYLHVWGYIGRTTMPVDHLNVGFLVNVAVQRLIDYIRTSANRPNESLEELKLWGQVAYEYHSLEDQVAERLDYQELCENIAALPPGCRIVMQLRLHGWRYGEIAAHLCIPQGTVKSRVNYAKLRLVEYKSAAPRKGKTA